MIQMPLPDLIRRIEEHFPDPGGAPPPPPLPEVRLMQWRAGWVIRYGAVALLAAGIGAAVVRMWG